MSRTTRAVLVVALAALAVGAANGAMVNGADTRDGRRQICDRPVSVNDGGALQVHVKRVSCNRGRVIVKRHFRGQRTRAWKCSQPVFQGRCVNDSARKRRVVRWYLYEGP